LIDRQARDHLALNVRRLASGRLSVDSFGDVFGELVVRACEPGRCMCGYEMAGVPGPRCPECGEIPDPALAELAAFGWASYSDFGPSHLRGKARLDRRERNEFARAVLFLWSDLEYTGPSFLEMTGMGRSEPWSKLARRATARLLIAVAVVAAIVEFAGVPFGLVWASIAVLAFTLVMWRTEDLIRAWLRRRRRGPAIDPTAEPWPFPSWDHYIRAAPRHQPPLQSPTFARGAAGSPGGTDLQAPRPLRCTR
jgi:hypothetical protein